MIVNLAPYRWWMPSARIFLGNLVKKAAQGVNTVVLLTDLTHQADLATQLADIFQQQGAVLPYTLDLSNHPNADPLIEISSALRVHGNHSLEKVLQAEGQPRAFIVFGMDAKAEQRQKWAVFASDWASVPKNGTPGNVIIVFTRFYGQTVPKAGERLYYARWNAEVSALEMSQCCRLFSQANNIDPALQRWIEAMLSSLAVGDEAFAAYVWAMTPDANGMMCTAARDYAAHLGWREADARRTAQAFPTKIKQRGSPELSDWWGRGWLINSVEYGLELHTALLALTPEGSEIINRRIWRAQAALMLPEIDRLRSRLIIKAKTLFKNHWKLSDITELGELEGFLHSENQRNSHVSDLLSDAYFARQIRNDLAHYKPVSFDHYNELLERNRGVV